MSQNQYFASQDAKELSHDLEGRFDGFLGRIGSDGVRTRWLKSAQLYFGQHFNTSDFNDSAIKKGGKEGELQLLTVNHYRNLIKHILIMATNQRPSFDVRAINSDLKSLQQAKLGNNILDSYLKEKRLSRYLKTAAEQALVFGKGFVKITWEPSLGRPHTVDRQVDELTGEVTSERMIYEGDVDVSTPSPFDVYVDPTQEDWNKCEWILIRSFRNKYSLASRYVDLKNEIEELPTKEELDGRIYQSLLHVDETSDVPIYEFYHKRTDALPNGRYMLFCNGDTVLYDGPIPYKSLPVYRITPGEIFGTTEGYTDAFDLMALQEAINVLSSTIFSNQNAFGIQNVLVPEGCNLSVEQITESLAVLKYNPQAGKPEPLQLTSTPPEIFQFLNLLERTAETLSGVNSVSRGNPESSLKSGVALGLIQSMAVQYASGFQQSWAELLEDCGSSILDLLKTFATTERMVAMAGKHNRGNMAHFTKDDLQNVDRVIVELGNPMSRTTAGRVQIADNLLEKGLIKTPQEYLTVLNSGQLDPLTEAAEAELALIRKENEELMDGRPVQALILDSHVLHMQEHKALLANPQVRNESQIVSQVLAHIQEHMGLYKNQDPLMSMISGEPPAPQPPPMLPPPPPAGPGPMPGPMPGGDQGPMNEPQMAPQVPMPMGV